MKLEFAKEAFKTPNPNDQNSQNPFSEFCSKELASPIFRNPKSVSFSKVLINHQDLFEENSQEEVDDISDSESFSCKLPAAKKNGLYEKPFEDLTVHEGPDYFDLNGVSAESLNVFEGNSDEAEQTNNDAGSICHLQSEHEFLPEMDLDLKHTVSAIFTRTFPESKKPVKNIVKMTETQIINGKITQLKNGENEIRFFRLIRNKEALFLEKPQSGTNRFLQLINKDVNLNEAFFNLENGKLETSNQERKLDMTLINSKQTDSLISTVSSEQETGVGCKCKKTNCLKLYCECFIRGGMCGKNCKCENCMNNLEHLEIRNLLMADHLEKRNVELPGLGIDSDHFQKLSFKNVTHCRCSKTGCNKRYCECFRVGRACTARCVCKNCDNCEKGEKTIVEETANWDKKSLKRKKTSLWRKVLGKMKIESMMFRKLEMEDSPDASQRNN